MNKTWLIVKREYLSRVRKRSFVIITLLIPVLLMAFIAIEVFLIGGGSKATEKIAVIDESGQFIGKLKDGQDVYFTYLQGRNPDSYKNQYDEDGYQGMLYIPKFDLNTPQGFVFYSRNQLGLGPYTYITDQINQCIEDQRMLAAGIDRGKLDSLKADVSLLQPSADNQSQQNTEGATLASTAVGYVSGILIYFVLFLFGTQVMRGVMEEKMNRISEVMISSVRPFQLMMGKIIGIGGVGLTQFAVWIILAILLYTGGLASVSGFGHHTTGFSNMPPDVQQAAVQQAINKAQGLINGLPILEIVLCFIFYFLGGFFMYAALFAAVGSAVDQDIAESQSLVFPVTLPILLSFFIMFNAIQQPNSPLSIWASIFPLSSPLVMIARIPFGVPAWQLGLSMVFLILGFMGTTWIAAKVYRTGILLYGKKITLKEMGKWLLRKG